MKRRYQYLAAGGASAVLIALAVGAGIAFLGPGKAMGAMPPTGMPPPGTIVGTNNLGGMMPGGSPPAPPAASTSPTLNPTEPIFITLEEHWISNTLASVSLGNPQFTILLNALTTALNPNLIGDLRELGDARLANMTATNHKRQVLSHPSTPDALDRPDLMTAANDELADVIATHPDRWSGFAVLPMAQPAAAAAELERAVRELGFVGALIDNKLPNGTFYDGEAYGVFWAKAQELGVPIYLHPTVPSLASFNVMGGSFAAVESDFGIQSAVAMGTVSWGSHQDIGLHFLRLYSAGVFQQFPQLKVVLGHMGEMVPYYLERANATLSPLNPDKLSVVDTWRQNVWVTTSAVFSTDPMATLLRNTAIDRIMYSVDYPFGSNTHGQQFMADLKGSGLVNEAEWEMIAFRNAQTLLGVN